MKAYEQEVAQRWWALSPGALLPLSNGGCYRLLYTGRPGGAAGPDVRDAVLYPVTARRALTMLEPRQEQRAPGRQTDKRRLTGDVEFHVHASDWTAHQHHSDPRYNQVILHVVLICDDPYPTTRQDGRIVPVCSLHDLPDPEAPLPLVHGGDSWPCQRVMATLSIEERSRLLQQAGRLRFEQKTHTFVEQLHRAEPVEATDRYDVCLIPALAEGLGFGRDRDFFRAVGLHLLGKAGDVPEPLGRAPQPAPLDSGRLQVLARLVARWRTPGVWQRLRALLQESAARADATRDERGSAARGEAARDGSLQAMRREFCELGLSLARTDILICNIVLPFAAAVSLLERDEALGERARVLYGLHPGLPANRITRMMCAQLQLVEEPRGSCQQQGLQHIYQQTCREKYCEMCIIGRKEHGL